ncbi:formimidoylglutamase [Chitinophaga horti]|uniref:Formimidoylglutamase n=1 Tax=Chitinophaga horti TaxID=2920382 RepID=A0ABY6IVU5_9BACT|nr:formimidoylglutamase [Chitinophaga horti]UYQ91503.1 formimidoylglutamase [Chitinophaga horti]
MIPSTFYNPPVQDYWQGRVDGTDAASLRWHQVVQCVDVSREVLPALQASQQGIVLLGFASDEGVRRNKGRVGAAQGPLVLRRSCASFPVHFEGHLLIDGGDINCANQDLSGAQQALATAVKSIIAAGYLPLLIGGGHEITYGHASGIYDSFQQEEIGLVNFDAHFDLRVPGPEGASSGTGFWQLAEDCRQTARSFHYLALGIQQNSNTRRLFDTADSLGVMHLPGEYFHVLKRESLLRNIHLFLDGVDKVYLTTCLDVFAAAFAPGVSATAYNGIQPDALFLECYREILYSGKLAGVDIAELNPSFDFDNRTAKLAASIVFETVVAYFQQ